MFADLSLMFHASAVGGGGNDLERPGNDDMAGADRSRRSQVAGRAGCRPDRIEDASEVSAPVVVTLSARSIQPVVDGAVVVSVAPLASIGVVTLLKDDHAASCPPAAMATIRSSSCVVVRPVTLTAVYRLPW